MKENITGMMVYYYFVCKRKLWYFCHEITMETENEDVLLGKLLDESSYKKNDKHISIDQIINIDFMKKFGVFNIYCHFQKFKLFICRMPCKMTYGKRIEKIL